MNMISSASNSHKKAVVMQVVTETASEDCFTFLVHFLRTRGPSPDGEFVKGDPSTE